MLTFLIDPARLIEMPAMQQEIEALVKYVKASPAVDEAELVMVAGDPERISIRKRNQEGIPVDETTWEHILTTGESMGLERPRLMSMVGD